MKVSITKATLILSSVYLLTACTDAGMRFAGDSLTASKAETPVDGWLPTDPEPTPAPTPVVVAPTPTPAPTATPVVVVPPPASTPVVVVPTPTPAPPQQQDECQVAGVSQKGCYLAKIMEMGCPFFDSQLAGYVAPTRAQVIANLDQCSEAAYPTTVPTAAQMDVIQRLINPNDASFRQYFFTGLHYKPPYTEEFVKYFGVELYNAKYTFCNRNYFPPGYGSINPGPNVNINATAGEYQRANQYAEQIHQCVIASKYTN